MHKFLCLFMITVMIASLFSLYPNAAGDGGLKIIAFGDSITASGIWLKGVDDRLGTSIINMGVGGENSADGLKRLKALLNAEPDVVTIMFGANDTALDMAKAVPMDTYISNMRKMITSCTDNGIKVIVILQSYFEAGPYYTRHDKSVFESVGGIESYMDTYIDALRALAKELDVPVADVRSMCDAYPVRSELLADGVHPNQKGYDLYAQAVSDAIIKLYKGDINTDGNVNICDYLAAKRAEKGHITLDKTESAFADLDGDGVITHDDCEALKNIIKSKGE